MGDLIFFHQGEIFFRIETFHDDVGAAKADGKIDRGLGGGMIQRRRREKRHALTVPPQFLQEFMQQRAFVRGRKMPLGLPVVPEE